MGGIALCIDDAEIAHLGFYRDPTSLEPVPYYANMPRNLADRDVFVLPGSIMDAPEYLRISLTASDQMIERALPAFAQTAG